MTNIWESIKLYPEKSILFVGIASVGKIGYLANRCYSNQQITAIKLYEKEFSKFVAYSLLASMVYTKTNALYTTVPIINNAYLGTIKIALPKQNEMEIITKFLDEQCKKIDDIINDKINELKKLKEYRKSLIYEFVTGKKRVKEA